MILFVFKTSPKASFTDKETEKLTDRIQNAGTEVVNAKAGSVSNFFVFVQMHLTEHVIRLKQKCCAST